MCNENDNERKDKLRRAFRPKDRESPVEDDCSCATHVRFGGHLGEQNGRLGSSVALYLTFFK